MAKSIRQALLGRPGRWTAAFLISLAWLCVVAMAVRKLRQGDGVIVALMGLGAAAITFAVAGWSERARWRRPVEELARLTHDLRHRGRVQLTTAPEPELQALLLEIGVLVTALRAPRRRAPSSGRAALCSPARRACGRPLSPFAGVADPQRSLRCAAPRPDQQIDASISGEHSTIDMVNRIDPKAFHWIESSPAEQDFLGWTLAELQQKSFLEIVHPDDRDRAEETFAQAIVRGEALGLIVRIRRADGRTRAIEVNVGARYGTNQRITHLRCHLSDVTEKVHAERELRLRTRELTQLNEQLRRINRELEDLKDRYTDLYENAPAMYFSVDQAAILIECNQTMLSTLNRPREEIIGRSYESLLPEHLSQRFRARFQAFLNSGSIEEESTWVKSGGETIGVWIHGTLIKNSKGAILHARMVAQDVTAKRRLEAELQEKNRRLAEANDELSLKNRELDEFVYVVSHDLQEPLRTLTSFSGFLSEEYADRLEAEGQEYVRYVVDASRRMRAMIQGLLHLSRAGRVIGDFAEVDLDELLVVIKADLAELMRSKGAELRVHGPLPRVWGDRDRIGQLLANLIANGIKYNESPNKWVEVAATRSPDSDPSGALDNARAASVTISIKDNGIGIEAQFHNTIFQLFRRLHSQEEYDGTGVGLAICNKIVQAHGGRIWVESDPGHGATFFVRLRAVPTTVPALAVSSPNASGAPYESPVSQVPSDERHPV